MNLQEKTPEDLRVLLADLEKEIFALRNELKVARKLEKPHLLKEKKRMKASILRIIGENL